MAAGPAQPLHHDGGPDRRAHRRASACRASSDTIALYLLGDRFSAASACWAMGVALRTRTIQAAPAHAGRDLPGGLHLGRLRARATCSPAGWRTVADVNPVTYLLEASRAAELTGLGWAELWPALVALSAPCSSLLGTWAVTGLATLGAGRVAAWRSTALPSTSRSPPTSTAWPRVPADLQALYREMEGDERARMMTHPDLGALLEALVRATGGRAVLEVGTFVGTSAAWMARALAPGGRIDTLEADPDRADRAEAFLARAGLGDRVRVHRGPAARDPPGAARRRLRPLLHRRRQDRLPGLPRAGRAAGAAGRADPGRQRPLGRPRGPAGRRAGRERRGARGLHPGRRRRTRAW